MIPDPSSAIRPTIDLTGYFLAGRIGDAEPMILDGDRFGLELTPFILPVFSTEDKVMEFLRATDAPIPCLMAAITDSDGFIGKARESRHMIIIDPEYSEDPETGDPILKGVVVDNPEVN